MIALLASFCARVAGHMGWGFFYAAATWLPALTAPAFVPTLVRSGSLTPGETVGPLGAIAGPEPAHGTG